MRPVLAGICQYTWLSDGSVDLMDLARMNDALAVRDENETRIREASKTNGR